MKFDKDNNVFLLDSNTSEGIQGFIRYDINHEICFLQNLSQEMIEDEDNNYTFMESVFHTIQDLILLQQDLLNEKDYLTIEEYALIRGEIEDNLFEIIRENEDIDNINWAKFLLDFTTKGE